MTDNTNDGGNGGNGGNGGAQPSFAEFMKLLGSGEVNVEGLFAATSKFQALIEGVKRQAQQEVLSDLVVRAVAAHRRGESYSVEVYVQDHEEGGKLAHISIDMSIDHICHPDTSKLPSFEDLLSGKLSQEKFMQQLTENADIGPARRKKKAAAETGEPDEKVIPFPNPTVKH